MTDRNTLHGGPEGLGRLVWNAEPDDATNAVVFSLVSPDGAMGYPGTLHLKATYRLEGNRLRLEFGATTDKPTPLSLVQHQYFNLGTGDDVLDHRYTLATSAYTESDDDADPDRQYPRGQAGLGSRLPQAADHARRGRQADRL